jgi:hypothetical protein
MEWHHRGARASELPADRKKGLPKAVQLPDPSQHGSASVSPSQHGSASVSWSDADVPSESAADHLAAFASHVGGAASHLYGAIGACVHSSRRCSRFLLACRSSLVRRSDAAMCKGECALPTCGVIFPTDPWKERWDTMVTLLIIYSVIAVPFRVAFQADAEGYLWIFE